MRIERTRVPGLVLIAAVATSLAIGQNSGAGSSSAAGKALVLRRDTVVQLRLADTVSSADRHKGDTIRFQVSSDVVVNGVVVIPSGTEAVAKIAKVYKRAAYRDGYLEFSDPALTLSDGRKVRLSGETAKQRREAHAMCTAAVVLAPVTLPLMAAAYAISLPADSIAGIHKEGKAVPAQYVPDTSTEKVLYEGQDFMRYVRDNVRVTVSGQYSTKTATNASVL